MKKRWKITNTIEVRKSFSRRSWQEKVLGLGRERWRGRREESREPAAVTFYMEAMLECTVGSESLH
jgi:hypothetical protein